ncbi:MAG: hypothetical protein KAU49_04575 [Candidatus Krumholzibacteria bacterium]|nr:hypothetical protein [Candidatus Krumholzibacteria bacterium]
MADTDDNGRIRESRILEDASLDSLYKAAENIRDLFAPLEGTALSDAEIDAAELSVRRDIRTLYIALFGMAVAELEMKAKTSAWFFLSTVSYEFDEIAHITAEIPYSTRGDNKFLEITNLILRFFAGDDKTEKRDLFYFLKGISGVNLSSMLSEISEAEKRLLHYVYTAVARHISADPRYRRYGSIITDLEKLEKSTGRRVTADEIIAGCAPLLRGSERPGRIVGMIFDWLLGNNKYDCCLHMSALRTAVYELIKIRFIPQKIEATKMDPMQEYLQKEMFQLARETLDETTATYGWRKGGSAEYREAFGKAGWDMLEEIIIHGRKIQHHEALGRHIDGCNVEVYREKYMGSFQNFWKGLWDNFLKKIRADI